MLTVREAVDSDADLLLRWRNDPVTRSWSRDTEPVPAEEHRRWFTSVRESATRLLLVASLGEEPVGVVRLDRSGFDEWEVSITVSPEHRGRGLGGRILAEGERELAGRVEAATIVANVHRDNAASVALFRGAGYRERPELGAAGPFTWYAKEL